MDIDAFRQSRYNDLITVRRNFPRSSLRPPCGIRVHTIDHIDRMIVGLLQQDGRMPAAEIARRVGNITERAVRYRLERLIADGVIRVRAIVNPKAVGFGVIGDIMVEVESGHVRDVARMLTQFESVGYVAFSMGQGDISLQVNARDADELYRFASEVIGGLPWVRKTVTYLVPLKLKDIDNWQIPEPLTEKPPSVDGEHTHGSF
jgi:Lrp/AsnC family transcriptional regulator for asnA, asnC and gidA